MTTKTQTHNLKADGAPFKADGTPVHEDKSTKGEGYGKCSCGKMSGVPLGSRGKRQQWHKTHKMDPTGAGLQPPVAVYPGDLIDVPATEEIEQVLADDTPVEHTVTAPASTTAVAFKESGISTIFWKSFGKVASQAVADLVPTVQVTYPKGGQVTEITGPDADVDQAVGLLRGIYANAADDYRSWKKTSPEYARLAKRHNTPDGRREGAVINDAYWANYVAQQVL